MAYIGKSPFGNAVRTRFFYTASGGETSLSGADSNGKTLSFTDGNYVDVYLNGVLLITGTDYNTSTENTIAGLSALTASDNVEIVVYETFSLFNSTFNGNLIVNEDLTVDTSTLHVDSTNNRVGIGTTSPATALDVTGTVTADAATVGSTTSSAAVHSYTKLEIESSSHAALQLSGSTGGEQWIWFADDSSSTPVGGITYYHGGPYMGFRVEGSERMRIDSSGNVGIGTSSPSSFDAAGDNLVVGTGSGNNGMTVYSGTGNAGSLFFADGTSTAAEKADGYIQFTHSNQALAFATAATERMRIDSSGNVLVGTTDTSPHNNSGATSGGIALHSDSYLSVGRSSGAAMFINRQSNDGDIIDFRKDGTKVGSIGVEGGDNFYITDNNNTGLNMKSGLIIPCNTNGSTRGDAIDLGANGGRFKDLYLSGGVYVGGTGSANKLDDYEEGTWTPTIATGTINAGSARYTKIGNLVHVTCTVTSFSDRTSTSNVIIGGLPFSCVSGGFAVSSTLARYINTPIGGDAVVMYQAPSSTTLVPHTTNQNSNYDSVAHNNLSSTSTYFYISHTYRT